MKAFRLAPLVLLTSLSAAWACSAPPGNGTESGDGDGDGGDGDGDGDDGPPVHERCEESKLAAAALRRLTAEEFQASIEDIFPEITGAWGGVALGADPIGYTGFTNDARTLLVGPQSAEEIFRTALDVATLVSEPTMLATLLPCSETSPDSACATTFVDLYGERIFRQALSESDRSELIAYFDSVAGRSEFHMAMKWMIVTMPVALFRLPKRVRKRSG